MIDYSNQAQFDSMFKVDNATRQRHRQLILTDPEYVEAFEGLIEVAKARDNQLLDTPIKPSNPTP